MELGNQQERLAFLGGLLEGEGTITIQRSNKRKNGKNNLLPVVQIANSNEILIEFVADALRALDVGPYVYWRQSGKYAKSATVHIGGYQRCAKFLSLVTPYLVSKKPQAELVLAMCTRRKDAPKNTPYSKEDLLAVEQVRGLNVKPTTRMRLSSEAICRAPNVTDDGGMIWSDPTGDRGRPAELETTGPIAA